MQKKSALISAAWDDTDGVFEIVPAYYKKLCDYMSFQDMGVIEGSDSGSPETTRRNKVMEESYNLKSKPLIWTLKKAMCCKLFI